MAIRWPRNTANQTVSTRGPSSPRPSLCMASTLIWARRTQTPATAGLQCHKPPSTLARANATG
eukprot:11227276-Lingulodinium_polyedra.AAC.1